MKLRVFFLNSMSSLLLFLAIFWVNLLPVFIADAIYFTAYGILMWCMVRRYATYLPVTAILTAIIFGRILIEIPFRIKDFSETICSLPFTLWSCAGVIAAYVLLRFTGFSGKEYLQ